MIRRCYRCTDEYEVAKDNDPLCYQCRHSMNQEIEASKLRTIEEELW